MEAKLITFEGIDGSGKSSAAKAAHIFLQERGIPSILTRQPGGTRIGEQLRTILKLEKMSSISEVLLFAACFQESYEEIIKPNLDKGVWVLCDRFTDSTIAYQAGGRGVDIDIIKKALALACPVKPSLTLLYDLEALEAAKRVNSRGELDKFEQEGVNFQEKIRKTFLKIAEVNENNAMHVIDTKINNEVEVANKTISIIETSLLKSS